MLEKITEYASIHSEHGQCKWCVQRRLLKLSISLAQIPIILLPLQGIQIILGAINKEKNVCQ